MPADHLSIVFTTLAFNQTVFFGAVGAALRSKGYKVSFICFHQRSAEYLRKIGFEAASAYEYAAYGSSEIDFSRYGIKNVNIFLAHEKVAFGIHDSTFLTRKLWRFLCAVDEILSKHVSTRNAVMVQEFGGFLSLVAAFYAARAKGLDNIFIEPSFFRGRVVFVRNSFSALPVPQYTEIAVSAEVSHYIEQTLNQQQLVIPKKDSHHYRSAFKKIQDRKNIRRLFEKLVDKHVLGKREEFEHIGVHVGRHLTMLLNSFRMKRLYRLLPLDKPFIYYPLHVPHDAALTVRSPAFLDQYALLDYISRVLPLGYKLAIKEHPALVGAIDYRRVSSLLRQNDNICVLSPELNNYRAMSAASAVVTINSKSGAEGLLLGKPVIVLGDAFYRPSPFAFSLERLDALPDILRAALGRRNEPTDQNGIRSYFQGVWNCSFPGELYVNEPNNVAQFSRSLVNFLELGTEDHVVVS